MEDVLKRLTLAVEEITEAVLCGEQPTTEQNRQLQELADRIKFLRNFAICLDSDSLTAIGVKHDLSHVRVLQIKKEGVPRIFTSKGRIKSGRPSLT